MRIDAITVCVNYADFLAQTLPFNLGQFDRLIVVTDTRDAETARVCREFGIHCVHTDAFYADGASFAKYAAVNWALETLCPQDWACVIDADIALYPHTRAILERMARQNELDGKRIYGADRLMVQNWKTWADFAPTMKRLDAHFVHTEYLPIGTRLAIQDRDGYLPLGFFQLWNPRVSGIDRYPAGKDAADGDALFSGLWPRNRRELIPEFVCVHLESEPASFGQNWRGRKTIRFEAPPSNSPMARREPAVTR
jgi:glycosyltransferase involved in cell wall biosynthesis